MRTSSHAEEAPPTTQLSQACPRITSGPQLRPALKTFPSFCQCSHFFRHKAISSQHSTPGEQKTGSNLPSLWWGTEPSSGHRTRCTGWIEAVSLPAASTALAGSPNTAASSECHYSHYLLQFEVLLPPASLVPSFSDTHW